MCVNDSFIFFRNGTEWWRIRKEFQKVLSKPYNVTDYLEDSDLVVQEFMQLCAWEKIDDFSPILARLFLECTIIATEQKMYFLITNISSYFISNEFSVTCLVAFDVRMHSLSEKERRPNSRSSRLIDAAFVTNSTILKLDNGLRLWRFFETPLYRKLRRAQNYMEE